MAAVMAEVGAGQRGILRARNAARDRLQATIPANYNPWLHLAATTGIGVAALVVGLVMIHAPTWRELLTIPLVFVFANAFEWRAHKDLLHHRRPPLQELYDRHTPEHHMVFGYDDMAIREPRELHRVLIPWIGVLGIVVAVAPLAWALGHFWSPNRGWLFLVCSAVYMVGYELSHTSYHLAPDSFVGRLALVRFLREHHRRHHHPRLMQRWNFNVTIPLFDWLHRSVVSEKELAETLAEDAASPVDQSP